VNEFVFSPQLKSASTDGTAVFLAAVFGNKDLTGDIVEPGAFTRTIRETPLQRVAFLADHKQGVEHRLGVLESLKETNEGLLVGARFNLEKQLSREIYSDFKMAPEAQEFSFSYDPVTFDFDEDGVRHLRDVSLYDVGPVWKGANPETRLLAVKKAAIGAHRTPVREGDWDGNAAMTSATSASDYRAICAWYSGADAEQRSSYKFPHHASPGGPAILAGVRNALARLSQASIPSSDEPGVRRHLQIHLDAQKTITRRRRLEITERLAMTH
jgi:HK97 family phage prohead protease